MLGATMALAWQDKYDIYATGRSNFQNNPSKKFLTFDFLHQDIEQLIEWAQPDVVIHCAAITDIDFCQSNPSLARIFIVLIVSGIHLKFDHFATYSPRKDF